MVFFCFLWDDIPTLKLNAKKTKKFQKEPKKPKKPKKQKKTSFQFRILAKTNAKKTKKTKKTNANLETLKNQKKNQKKQKKNQCQFADFGVATGFFLGEHPPPPNLEVNNFSGAKLTIFHGMRRLPYFYFNFTPLTFLRILDTFKILKRI